MAKSWKLLFGSVLAMASGVAVAHDFWVQPRSFIVPAPANVPITILVGHGQFRQRWAAPVERVVALKVLGPDGISEHRGELKPGLAPADAFLTMQKPGTYTVALETNPAKSDLPALRFNTYLKDEGIAPAIQYRQRTGQMQADGKEIYSRRAKSLVQVGPLDPASSAAVPKPIGMTLELVPERNPYTMKPRDPLAVHVLWHGQPLPGAFVKLTNLDFDAVPVETHTTDRGGRAVFAFPPRGAWQFNVIWTQPLRGNPDGDFATVFSSLTFGVPAKPLVP